MTFIWVVIRYVRFRLYYVNCNFLRLLPNELLNVGSVLPNYVESEKTSVGSLSVCWQIRRVSNSK